MTEKYVARKQKRSLPHISAGQLLFEFFSLFCLLLILKNSEIAIEYMSRGLMLCARTVIPSLFPFMVLSEMIVSGGIGGKLLRRISKPFRLLFGISEAGCCAVLLGMLCGFPVGAKCAILYLKSGQITKDEAERVLAFSGNPSSAFLISAVGTSLWGNRRFGIVLYVTVIGASVLSGILLNRFTRKQRLKGYFGEECQGLPSPPLFNGANLFTQSIKSATGSMLLVCAYVIFFSTFVGTLNLVLTPLKLPNEVHAVLFSVFELSCGVSQASALGSHLTGAIICAFAAGWSGLSVHFQTLSVADGQGLSFRFYFYAKLFQGVICALILGLLISLFPSLLVSGSPVSF